MCKKHNPRKVDECMRSLIMYLKVFGIKTCGCCCGHRKYPMTIVCNFDGEKKDIVSNKIIPRKKRFYVKDKQGYYFIPEVVNVK
jgi:hypothetical protein